MQHLPVFTGESFDPVQHYTPPHCPELLDQLQLVGEQLESIKHTFIYPFGAIMKMQQLRAAHKPG